MVGGGGGGERGGVDAFRRVRGGGEVEGEREGVWSQQREEEAEGRSKISRLGPQGEVRDCESGVGFIFLFSLTGIPGTC